jgi:hypothetical protein
MRQFEWRTECCLGFFITAYCSVFCTHSGTGWLFFIAGIATLQSLMAHPSAPHLLIMVYLHVPPLWTV